jgi:hypothetical protein
MYTDILDICPEADELRTMRFCDRYFIQPILDGRCVTLYMSTIPTMAPARRELRNCHEISRNIWVPGEALEEIKHFDFCPASGRLCVMTKSNVIYVVDYLMPI